MENHGTNPSFKPILFCWVNSLPKHALIVDLLLLLLLFESAATFAPRSSLWLLEWNMLQICGATGQTLEGKFGNSFRTSQT